MVSGHCSSARADRTATRASCSSLPALTTRTAACSGSSPPQALQDTTGDLLDRRAIGVVCLSPLESADLHLITISGESHETSCSGSVRCGDARDCVACGAANICAAIESALGRSY